jgi:hypothetical protein
LRRSAIGAEDEKIRTLRPLEQEFGLVNLARLTARDLPEQTAFILDGVRQSYAETGALMDRIAAFL